MNGLEFARALTAGGFPRVLVHAAPAQLRVHVVTDDGTTIASGEPDRDGDCSPLTLLELDEDGVGRSDVWPDEGHSGLPVLLPGGEVGVLTAWEHAPDRSWGRWSSPTTSAGPTTGSRTASSCSAEPRRRPPRPRPAPVRTEARHPSRGTGPPWWS